MNNYKVEIKSEEFYIVDVVARDEEHAQELATKKWNEIADSGMAHYYQEGDTMTTIKHVYDVTGSDDPFNP